MTSSVRLCWPATGADADAKGEAEVEFAKAAPTEQEIEFEVTNIEPGGRVTFVIDGRDIATVVADKDGVAEFEADVRMKRRLARGEPLAVDEWLLRIIATAGTSGSPR